MQVLSLRIEDEQVLLSAGHFTSLNNYLSIKSCLEIFSKSLGKHKANF